MRRLVIDASIARAAGTTEAPRSTLCRTFLDAILETDPLESVCTPELASEWSRHASLYALRWQSGMFSRRRVSRIASARDEDLRRNLDRQARVIAGRDRTSIPSIRAAMAKDAHLLEAALAANGAVASLDEQVRSYYRLCAQTNRNLGSIPWVNPEQAEEVAVEWIRRNTPIEKTRTLGHAAASGRSGLGPRRHRPAL